MSNIPNLNDPATMATFVEWMNERAKTGQLSGKMTEVASKAVSVLPESSTGHSIVIALSRKCSHVSVTSSSVSPMATRVSPDRKRQKSDGKTQGGTKKSKEMVKAVTEEQWTDPEIEQIEMDTRRFEEKEKEKKKGRSQRC